MTSTLKHHVEKHVVTSGNYGFASAVGNPPLFTLSGKRVIYNVAPGQPVAYVVENGVTRIVSAGGLDASEIYQLFVGVGVDETGSGITTAIRHIGIEHISGCLPRELSASSPRCGAPQILDFYFDCTACDETYSVEVTVDDNMTRSFAPWNKSYQQFIGTIVTKCSSCDDCPVEHNCSEVACKLADALNENLDFKVGNKLYPDWKGSGVPRPYFATRLHPTSLTYCFAPQSEAEGCTSCTYVAGVKGITIRDTQYNFTGNLQPGSTTQTLTAQLASISDQINEFFKTEYGDKAHAGSSYTSGSYSDCCAIQLHINTVDANFTLRDVRDGEIVPVTSNNPFTVYGTVTNDPSCIDSTDTGSAARQTLTLTGNPGNTETVTINGKVYTFQTTLTNVNGNVLIGVDASESLTNLVAAINLGTGAGTLYATAMTLHATVSATNGAGDTLVATAKTLGTAANSYGTTETLAAGSWGAATMLGGTAASEATTTDYTCGIRIIAERIKGNCGCYISAPLNFYGRKITLGPVGDGWKRKPWLVVEVQAMELPAGFGSYIQWLEYQNIPGGKGRQYSRSNHHRGTFSLPDPTSRVNAVTARCDTNYCSYYLKSDVDKRKVDGELGLLTIHSNVHIPAADATTVAAWEEFQAALIALNPACKIIVTATCDTDLGVCETG